MLDFYLNIIFFISLSIVTILLGRGLERVDQSVFVENKKDIFEKIYSTLHLAEVDAILNKFYEKYLRLIRLTALKVDNLTNIKLNKIISQKKEALNSSSVDMRRELKSETTDNQLNKKDQ